MKKVIAVFAFAAMAVAAYGQSSKASIKVGSLAKVDGASAGWQKVAVATVYNSSSKADFLIGMSMETSLTTDTSVASQKYDKSTSTAKAMVEVLVTVDKPVSDVPDENAAYVAAPGKVIYDSREQTLWAKLDGSSCVDTSGDGIIQADECLFTPEEIGLILKTTAAHHFNFAVNDVGTGNHQIEVFARLSKEASSTSDTTGITYTPGYASADAWIGKGSLSIESVRLINAGSGTVNMN